MVHPYIANGLLGLLLRGTRKHMLKQGGRTVVEAGSMSSSGHKPSMRTKHRSEPHAKYEGEVITSSVFSKRMNRVASWACCTVSRYDEVVFGF